jgi:hypothetical protein
MRDLGLVVAWTLAYLAFCCLLAAFVNWDVTLPHEWSDKARGLLAVPWTAAMIIYGGIRLWDYFMVWGRN